MEYGFVYIWYDRKHKRYYIGCHWGAIDDGYICSSPWMKSSYIRRPQDFKRRILSLIFTNRKDMFVEEAYWQGFIKDHELRTRYYNIRRHGDNHWSNDENKYLTIKEKISKSVRKKLQDPEHQKRCEEGYKKRDMSWLANQSIRDRQIASIIKTMESKFPQENRRRYKTKVGTEEHKASQQELADRFWKNATAVQKKERSRKISEKLKESTETRANHMKSLKWYNNGSINVRKQTHPGEGWKHGRLKK